MLKYRLNRLIAYLMALDYDVHFNIQQEEQTLITIQIGDHQKRKKIYMESFFLEKEDHRKLRQSMKAIKSAIKTHKEVVKLNGGR